MKSWDAANPDKIKRYQRRYRLKNKARVRQAQQRWRVNNPERARVVNARGRVKHLYGLSLEEYRAYLEIPCAICGGESTVVDHCHRTDHIRMGLCRSCNVGLGIFRDSSDLLRQAAEYLDVFA